MFDWSPQAPNRVVYVSTESGVRQVHTFDLESGARRRVTDHPVGVVDGFASVDGEGVVWFEDESGDESGRWFQEPFFGGNKTSLDGFPLGWSGGLAQAPGIVAAVTSDEHGFRVHIDLEGQEPKEIYRHPEAIGLGSFEKGGFVRGALSADGGLLCLEHSEHGDLLHPALRVLDARSGGPVGEQLDGGMALGAAAWSPLHGDQRLAIAHEREGELRPGIWDVAAGTRSDIELELQGLVEVCDWWPDGAALLLLNLHHGRHRLYRYDLDSGATTPVESLPGTISHARVRPDGTVWYLLSQGHLSPRVLDESGTEVIPLKGEPAPPGRAFNDWSFENPHGQHVEGFYVTPEGSGPHPVVMLVHGGPTSADIDRWDPEVQAYVDAGFAVGMVNYRGSIGYGREWRDVLVGDIGGPELEDVNAGLKDLVERTTADPGRAVIAGWSWGGYVTLLELGKHPELWRCGVAGVPVGDYEASYEDLSPLLKAYDRALLGGTPSELPELMKERNPINFADDVRAPVLFVAGENDSRCPFRAVMLYVERLRARGHPHELYTFSAGHGSYDAEEQVRQMRVVLEFLATHVPVAKGG